MKRMKSSTKLVGQMAQQSTEKVQSIKSSLPDPFSIATTISQPLVDMLSSNAVPSTSTGSEPVFVRSPQITSLNSEWFIGSAKRSAHSGRQQLVAKVISTDTAKILNTDLGLVPKIHPKLWSDQGGEETEDSIVSNDDQEQINRVDSTEMDQNQSMHRLSLPPDPLNVKRLSELDNLLFPRIQNNSRSPSVASLHDKSNEAINVERLKNKTSLMSNYFEDGKRRVDYVIVFNKPTNTNLKSDAMIHYEQRSIFENNLRDEGLQLEYTDDISGAGHVFIKIYAPWKVLTRYAEIMKLKMPMKTMQTTWKMLFDDDENHSMRFTAPYSKDKEYMFDIPPQKELFFSTAQRAQVVEFILKRKSFSRNQDDVTEFGINKLLSDRVYNAAYPIHEGKFNSDNRSPRMQLIQNWATLKMAFKTQPLDEIRKYYGVKIALYFAWLGFYTSMLLPASVVGVLCFLFGSFTLNRDVPSKEVCNGTYDYILMCPQCAHDCNFTRMSDSCFYAKTTYLFDNPATVFFAIFMSLWATVYLEMWKRYAARITYRWDLSNFDAVEEYPRPEYLARLSNVKNRKLNVITRMYEPYIPFWRRQLPYTILSASVVLFLIMIAVGSVVSVIIYRSTIRSAIRFKRQDINKVARATFLQKYSNIVVSSSAAALNLVLILILNNLYSRIANYLTELEMPRTQTEFDNSLTLKMFLLQFVNYYSSIFYIAFFKGRFIGNPGEFKDESLTQEECATGGCLLELAIQLAIIMVGRQLFSAMLELCMPFIRGLYNGWIYRKENKVTRMNVPQWEDDFLLSRWMPTSLFYEYLEMVIQFGFVTIFVSAFPLAPLFALINNVFEIRLDARKMIKTYRRPVAQRVKNIGIWYRILDTICKLSVITNAMIIAFTTEFVPRFYYYFENGNLNGYVNSTLSYFDAKVVNEHLKLGYDESKLGYCVYADYREPPWVEPNRRYKFTSYYWRLLAVRLSFVVVFENVIATITSLMRWIIPDVPQQLRQQMRQHAYLTNELILQQEFQRAKEISEERKVTKKKMNGGIGIPSSAKPRNGSIDSVGVHMMVSFIITTIISHPEKDDNEILQQETTGTSMTDMTAFYECLVETSSQDQLITIDNA
ncbi:hypothetical protein RDWZM_008991 [Blomia tropicalis]|uniref:Anoctamin n=1 Tax=Blomia tropicalis TaxID=40697 RepID=A0A9Q0M2V3_BLOTA|nr:hypothetical protein RDWZM_008991 [Blomia tropicalis]